jgi:hypothetical protein
MKSMIANHMASMFHITQEQQKQCLNRHVTNHQAAYHHQVYSSYQASLNTSLYTTFPVFKPNLRGRR